MRLQLPVSEAGADSAKRNAALMRAVPLTRLVDYGVTVGDALELTARISTKEAPAWDLVAEDMAGRYASLAREAAADGCMISAAQAWACAAALNHVAQLAYNADEPRKAALYEAGRQAVIAHGSIVGTVSELQLPSPEGALYGWQVAPAGGAPLAAVVIVGGLSGWGAVYLSMAQALARRGVLCVLAEGPGQGSTRMRSGLHLDAETLPLFTRFVDHAHASGARRVGVCGNSFGGLFAAHMAAMDPRVSAVCINGAPMAPTVPDFRTAREQMAALFGVESESALEQRLTDLRMSPHKHRIDAAMLVVEGGRDPLVALGEQASFFDLGQRQRCQLMTWPDGEHTIYNHAAWRNAQVADWFCAQLLPDS
ncbi:alpha/beta fold hydrolase [Acidovorax sp. 99]|uniref:alpha/beta hydrolase family protein n=1 Tax=Acidovorax sp. 99 TaxID=2135634 RepID=UPI000E30FE38|nr:alpha/beta fold hydrolase [Acidovorax sp. 99]